MTSVPATTGGNPAATTGGTASNAAIAGNFDQFLLLLTTQLQNQNPLDPLDTNQFTQQLVQFASVEQQINTNTTLTQLLAATRSSNIASGLNFVGTTVTVDGATAQLSNGSANWQITAPRAASKAIVTITDADGNIVQTVNQSLNAGAQSFAWNGRTATGGMAPDGAYTISIDAVDASGQLMSVSTDATGVVDSVDVSGTTPVLNIGGMSFSADAVKNISRFS
jgi:flagellar basal-body rod modification protein FlgD